MAAPTNHVIARAAIRLRGARAALRMVTPGAEFQSVTLQHDSTGGPSHFGDFRNIFPLNTADDQKKSHHLRAGP